MAELPTGTVTFLFTDVEGSTRLLKQLRDRYGEVLAAHRTIVRAAFAEHEGHEIDTQGDAFFVVFRKARDAVLAAAACQRGLAAHAWPDGAVLRIRIGLHTGEPNVGDEGYHGLGVHRAARIMAAGHGGQILASQATHSLLEDDELPGIGFRDLGEYQLKDLDRPERIYQVDVDGLPVDFPPLRTTDAPTAYTGQEDELAKAAGSVVWRERLRTRRWIAAGVAVGVAAAGLVAVLVTSLGSGTAHALTAVDSNAVGFVDARTGRIAGEVNAGASPSHVAAGDGVAWVTNADDNTVSKIDPKTKRVLDTIDVGSQPSGIAVGNGAVWVANSLDGTVSEIDPSTDKVNAPIRVGNAPVGVASTPGAIWVANTGDRTITRIDAKTGVPGKPLAVTATELAFGEGSLWASQGPLNSVAQIDPASGDVVQTIGVGNGPAGIAFGSGAVWVANGLDGTVSRIDPRTYVVLTVPVGNGVSSLAADGRNVWVSDQFDGTLARIDPATNTVVHRTPVGNRPQGVGVVGGSVLVGVRQSGAGHRGGTLVFEMGRPTDSIDTAIAYDSSSWSILRMTNDGLVAFNRASGPQGTQLVPDLAESLPKPTDDGKTYTFTLRPGIRYSTGAPVKASDFRPTFERDFTLNLPTPYYYDHIVGAAGCKPGRKCNLSRGIVSNDAAGTVTFHLTAPDPEFLYKLALPFAYVLPAATPTRPAGNHPLPATGPYRMAVYRPKSIVRLVRNRAFHEWSKAAQPDGYPDVIVLKIGETPDAAVRAVLDGHADIFTTSQSETPPSVRTLSLLMTSYRNQVHTNPQPNTIALFLNTRVAPFNRLDVRRALNYAADRRAAVDGAGGPDVAQPTCQILPPAYPGYRPYCPYTAGSSHASWVAPDLARARALVARSGTRGAKVTVWSWSELPSVGAFAVKLLRSLGYKTTITSRADSYFSTVGDSRTRAQTGTVEWISDYPAASGFFLPVLTCGSFLPGNPGNANVAEFCDPKIDRQIGKALSAQAQSPDAARGAWEKVDRETVQEAPWVPLVNPQSVDVLSKRVGDYQYSPDGLGVLIDQLWVR
jgi:YVTN family beta-propeller protein